MPVKSDPCHPFASRIESCLQHNNYKEEKCLYALEALRQCCIKWGNLAYATCHGINIDKPYYVNPGIDKDSKNNQKQ